MKDFTSLDDERDELIDPFVKKLVAVGPSRVDDAKVPTESEKDESEFCSPPVQEDATPKQQTGNVIKLWVDARFQELERKMDTCFNELM